jgi:hypothetical protein
MSEFIYEAIESLAVNEDLKWGIVHKMTELLAE